MISVIIPVYNVEPYLDECLASVEKQSYNDWECILIDDGSIDRSGIICDEWASRDSRFKVIHKKNEGVSVARNTGIEKAKGEYICFIDSDDWVDEDYVSSMFSAKFAINVEIVVSGIRSISKEGLVVTTRKPNLDECYSISKENATAFINEIDLFYAPYAKLYKTDIIHKFGVRFPKDLSLGEDMTFVFEYLGHVKHVATISGVNYNYRRFNEGSLSTIQRNNIYDIWMRLWNLRVNSLKQWRMWCREAERYFAKDLWGIVYDCTIGSNSVSYNEYKRILNYVDVPLLKKHSDVFSCAAWIKFIIIHKFAFLIYLFKIFHR